MRARWRLLFWASLIALVGLSWVAQRYGAHLLGLLTLPVVGMIVGMIVAFVAMVRSSEARGPAWIVLACWIPAGADLIRALGWLGKLVEADGIAAVLLIAGTVATFGLGLWIAVAAPVAAKRDPIAPARVVD
ncbi:hypothetical protein BH11MYX1_BH11MYX1_18520 [soil metagenome]